VHALLSPPKAGEAMSRGEGFSIADIAVGFLRDLKLRRLRQSIPDDAAATTIVYIAVVLSSWAEGYRLSTAEADSPEEATPERVAALQAVELLDADGKIPLHAWESYFRPAWERREKMRRAGIEGNRRRWHPDRLSPPDSPPDSPPVSPSVPSDRTVRPSVSPPDDGSKKEPKSGFERPKHLPMAPFLEKTP
jgi:hypothetical protein